MREYQKFLNHKRQLTGNKGFEGKFIPDWLFDFQKDLLNWNLLKGRSATFADCGLGKTPLQLCWSQNVVEHTNKPVLLLAPLAVTEQTTQEAVKFNIDCERSRDGKFSGKRIIITNYERLHYFNPEDFGGVACDESSAIKSFNGKHRAEVTEFMRKMKYRSLWTATAAPNDFIELGTSSEAIGELGLNDMLNQFFRNDDNNASSGGSKWRGQKGTTNHWRFKGHSQEHFWRWVCSWARACRKPSDLGYSDDRFILPELIEREHIIEMKEPNEGFLFPLTATNFFEERLERRKTIKERCELAVQLIEKEKQSIIWCHLNPEGELLNKMIKDSIEVSGRSTDEEKEEAFINFAKGQIKTLIIKPKIGAWGMNWQNCSHIVTFASHSYEQYYQAIRRCWRFGQKNTVVVDLVLSEGEERVKDNMKRKAEQADKMFTSLITMVNNSLSIKIGQDFNQKEVIPTWL